MRNVCDEYANIRGRTMCGVQGGVGRSTSPCSTCPCVSGLLSLHVFERDRVSMHAHMHARMHVCVPV